MKVLSLVCTALLSTSLMASSLERQDKASTKVFEISESLNGAEIKTLVHRGSKKELKKIKGGEDPISKLPTRNLPTNGSTKPTKGGKDVIAVANEIIALGKEIYKIVDEGRPVVTVDSDSVSILPRDAKGEAIDEFMLSEWRDPIAKTYRVETSNGISGTWLEGTPVAFDFMLLYTYGGRYDGKGYYISGAQVNAKNLSVSWGYTLNVTVKNSSIINIGTVENPIASGIVTVEYTIKTILKETRNSVSFLISGIGKTKVY